MQTLDDRFARRLLISISAKVVYPASMILGHGMSPPLQRARWAFMAAMWRAGWTKVRIAGFINRRHETVRDVIKTLPQKRMEDPELEAICAFAEGEVDDAYASMFSE